MSTFEGSRTTGEVETPPPYMSVSSPEAPRKGASWEGPTLKVRITADETRVTTSTNVIGKPELSDSLFRKALEMKIAALKADESSSKEEKSSDVIDLWFDRNGYSLPIIISVLRGYDFSDLSTTAVQKKQIIADCIFYRVPFVAQHLFPGSVPDLKAEGEVGESSSLIRGFDATKIDPRVFRMDPSSGFLTKTGDDGKWGCVPLTQPFEGGNHSFSVKIVNSARMNLMIGVLDQVTFVQSSCFGKMITGVAFGAFSGKIYGKRTGEDFGAPAKKGDTITVSVNISESRSVGQVRVHKNGVPIGGKDLAKYVTLGRTLRFAVCMMSAGDSVKLV